MTRRIRRRAASGLLATVIAAAGCGYVRSPRYYAEPSDYAAWFSTTVIESDPPGATIEANGKPVGTTPLTVALPRRYLVRWMGVTHGGNRIVSIEPLTVTAIPSGPGEFTQQLRIEADRRAPDHIRFDMARRTIGTIVPAMRLEGEPESALEP